MYTPSSSSEAPPYAPLLMPGCGLVVAALEAHGGGSVFESELVEVNGFDEGFVLCRIALLLGSSVEP